MEIPASDIPVTLSAHTAESYDMSIRFLSDGLVFSLSDTEGKACSTCTYPFDSGAEDYCAAVKELFFHYQHLTFPYRRVHVSYRPDSYVLIPRALYEEGRADYWLRTAVHLPDEGKGVAVMEYNLPHQDKMLILTWDKPLYEFLRRTQIGTEFTPGFIPFFKETERQSRQHTAKRVALNLRHDKLDLFVFEGGSLLFANTYSLTDNQGVRSIEEEVLFYLVTVWKSLRLDIEHDRIVICIQQNVRDHSVGKDDLRQILEPFFRHIELCKEPV